MKQDQVNFTVTAAEKKQIEKLAEACGLSHGEYLRQRALGGEPKAVLPDAFFLCCSLSLLAFAGNPQPE